jgi:hypothetical protein
MRHQSRCFAPARSILALLFSLICLTLCRTGAAEERFIPRDMRPCSAEHAAAGYQLPCKQPLSADAITTARGKLGTRNFAYEVKGELLTVSVRMPKNEVAYPNGPFLCCEIQAYLDPAGDDVYAASFRWNRMGSAMLDLQLLNQKNRPDAHFQLRGSLEFVFAGDKVVPGLIEGAGAELSTRTYAAPSEYAARKVTVFKGAACRETVAACTVVYTPDGHDTAKFVDNALANGIDLRRVVVVGVHNADVDPAGSRIEELVLDSNPVRYDAFMRFVTEDLRRQIEGSARPLVRLAAGYSNGGAWAYDALVSQGRHFDGAIIMSPAQWRTRGEAVLQGRRVFVGAGYMERPFYQNAKAITAVLEARGAQVSEVYVPSGHGLNTWVNIWNAALPALGRQPD